jgi:hypothetical protein
VAINRRAVKVVIKADHAKRLSARDVQGVRNEGNDTIVDVAKLLLQIVQNWQRRARDVPLAIDQRPRQIQIKGRSARHDILPEPFINALGGAQVQIEPLEYAIE